MTLVRAKIDEIEKQRKEKNAPDKRRQHHSVLGQFATIRELWLDTTDMLTNKFFFRDIANHRALMRYAGLTGTPGETGENRREKELTKAGILRIRNGMIPFA